MNDSVGELIKTARAPSEGEFKQQLQQHFQGELNQLAIQLDSVSQSPVAGDTQTGFQGYPSNGLRRRR